MAKSSFNLAATNAGFGVQTADSTVGPHTDRAVHARGPHFELPKDQAPPKESRSAAVRDRRVWLTGVRALSVVALLVVLLVGGFCVSRPWQRQALAARWQADLHEAEDAIALVRVRQLGQLGPPGVRVLGGAVGIRREAVARAARLEVLSLLAQWELLEPSQNSPLIAALAGGMAESMESFDREGRQFAGEIARRILVWPVDRARTNRAPLIADCEAILLAVGRTAAPTATSQPTPAEQPAPAEARLLPSSVEVEPLARVPAEATAEGTDAPVDEESNEPPAKKSPESVEPKPDAPSEPTSESQAPPRELSRAVTEVERPVRTIEEAPDEPLPVLSGRQTAWFAELNSDDEQVVASARAELAKLGLGPTELEIARLSTHPEAAVRKKLARALPQIPGIDARAWLEFLAEDPDAEVRRTALGLLATSGDRESASRLRR